MSELKRAAKNGDAPAPLAALTLGAVRDRLRQNGYTAVSALVPHGWVLGQHPHLFPEPVPDYLQSEHPVAVRCVSKLAAMIVRPAGDDAELAQRIRAALDAAGLTAGPYRTGSDGTVLWPLRFTGYGLLAKDALDASIRFLGMQHIGPFGEGFATLIPLDGAWHGSLLDTPAAALPEVSDEAINAVLAVIKAIPAELARERRPPPKPSRRAWIGG